jgi:plasmid stabilization system protein ParE
MMKLVVAPEAAAQILVRKRWWRANRSKAPERFDEELAAALTVITERPESFPVFSAQSDRTVRRCLLAKTRCHLYFEVRPGTDEVWIIAARGAAQQRAPRLGR